ncbi:MAG: integrase core domain-containing protein [Prochlorococcaceae cyanobacterium]
MLVVVPVHESRHPQADFVLAAEGPPGVVRPIHTDQGSHCPASDYRKLLQKNKIICSMSTKGWCWDNAVMESFFSTLKLELDLDDDRDVLLTPQQLQSDLAFWIEGYYNRERGHSTIGYLSPIEYKQRPSTAPTLTLVNP